MEFTFVAFRVIDILCNRIRRIGSKYCKSRWDNIFLKEIVHRRHRHNKELGIMPILRNVILCTVWQVGETLFGWK